MSRAKTEEADTADRISYIAVTAFLLGLCGFCCTVRVLAIGGLPLGILALVKIIKGKGRLRGRGFAIVGIAISMLLTMLVDSVPSLRARKILRAGRLANLPESATELKAEGWHAGFAGAEFLTFRTTPDQIEKFIADSPGIRGLTPELFTPEHMYLPNGEGDDWTRDPNYLKHEYFYPDSMPPWWKPVRKGRRYRVPHSQDCQLIIDDETNTVYIMVVIG
ncbi:MAG: DUF4190 domain-containing protein [Planctomycetota bacterium]|jgi:hypothetical protein